MAAWKMAPETLDHKSRAVTESERRDHADAILRHGKGLYSPLAEVSEMDLVIKELSQRGGTHVSERPYSGPKMSELNPNISYYSADKFTYSLLNLIPPQLLEKWTAVEPDFSELLSELIKLHKTFSPFISFCNLQLQGESGEKLIKTCEQNAEIAGLPKAVAWNREYDADRKLAQFHSYGHFEDRLRFKDFSVAHPLSTLADYGLVICEIDQLNGKFMKVGGKSIKSSISQTSEGYVLDTVTPSGAALSSWGQGCRFENPQTMSLESDRTLSEITQTLCTTTSRRPIAFSIVGEGALKKFEGQIFVPNHSEKESVSALLQEKGVPLPQDKFVTTVENSTSFQVGGFINSHEVYPVLTTGASQVEGVHSHVVMTFDRPDGVLSGSLLKATGETQPMDVHVQKKDQQMVIHALSDYVIPKGSLVSFV